MPNLLLTDMYGDPIIVPWDKVMLVEEVRRDVEDDDGTKLRVHEATKVWLIGGWSNYAKVKESVPEIMALVNAPTEAALIEQAITEGIAGVNELLAAKGW